VSLPPLATPADVATRLQRVLTAQETAAATAALAAASDVIRGETRQDFTAAAGDTLTLGVMELGVWLTLPQQPVTAVAAVEIDGQAVTDFTVVPGRRATRLYRRGGWYGAGLNTIVGSTGNLDATIGDPVSFVMVTCDHGFDTIPADVVAVAVNLALPHVVNPEGVTAETVGNYASQVDNGRADAQTWLLTVDDLTRRYSIRRPLRSVLLSRTWDR
jgi:hypothetical protein